MWIVYFYNNALEDRPIAASLVKSLDEAAKEDLPSHTNISQNFYTTPIDLDEN
jgi:hypothetical protein